MPTLLLRFPGGRYHATPWGHHVNEGLVEWPPSPWRLIRALLACGFGTQGWTTPPPEARTLIESLAGTLPRYRMPPASLAHSRHYMPLGILDKGREKTTLVFDAWANVGDGVMVVRWDAAIDDRCQALFERLVASLGYLGRSESWVEGRAIDDTADLPAGEDAVPFTHGETLKQGWEQISLIAPVPASQYLQWRESEVTDALAPFPLPQAGRKAPAPLLRNRTRAQAPYPTDLLDCLQRDTAWWQSHGWSQPPGSQRVLYWRRKDSLSLGPPAPRKTPHRARVPAMLLALSTPSGRLSGLPPRTRALPQAEMIHRSIVSRAGGGELIDSPELTGRDANGHLLKGHRHAHILSLDLDNDKRLDHILIFAPMGLGSVAQDAIRGLKRTFSKGGVESLRVALAGSGAIDNLRKLPAPLGTGVGCVLGPLGGARIWESVTPFVAPRYRKARGRNSLEGQVLAELTSRGLPEARVDILPWDDQSLDLRHAVRIRRRGSPPPPSDAGFLVRLLFEQPVLGPLALGYGAHFGLGLFAALQGRSNREDPSNPPA